MGDSVPQGNVGAYDTWTAGPEYTADEWGFVLGTEEFEWCVDLQVRHVSWRGSRIVPFGEAEDHVTQSHLPKTLKADQDTLQTKAITIFSCCRAKPWSVGFLWGLASLANPFRQKRICETREMSDAKTKRRSLPRGQPKHF